MAAVTLPLESVFLMTSLHFYGWRIEKFQRTIGPSGQLISLFSLRKALRFSVEATGAIE
jgi:hypothetical protein